METPARRTSSRLSLSRKFSASKAGSSRASVKSTDNPTTTNGTADDTKLAIELSQNPFKLSERTLAQEDDLLSAAPDAVSLASRDSPELKPTIATIPECIEISSDSESEATPKKKLQQDQNSNFFTPQKSRKKGAVASSSGLGVSTLKSTTRKTAVSSSSKTNQSSARNSSKVQRVRKQICKSSNIKMLTSKYFDSSQKRIPTFFQKKEDNEGRMGYHATVKRSLMPAINTGDENIEDFLAVEVTEGNEPLRPSQLAGPRLSQLGDFADDPQAIMERIEAAQSACIDDTLEAINMEEDQVAMALPPAEDPDVDSGISNSTRKPTKTPANKRKSAVGRPSTAKRSAKARAPIIVPKYKIVAGTNFAVDAFRYGDINGVSHYFLSHYHADHYIGLKKSFDKPLIMSPITAKLVEAFIKVDPKHYILLDLHESIVLDGVKITALDANHCPGAVLFLFQLPTGTNILHTGDFRASPAMEEYPELWNMDIHTIYLDTTYLSTKYCFKDQWQSVSDAVHEVKTFLAKHIGANVLIVCGSYLVGKEKVWLELAAQTGFRVWTEPNRRKAVDAVAAARANEAHPLDGVLVEDPKDAQIHVLSMGKLNYDELVAYMDEFPERDCVLALRPSGWEKNSRPQYRGRINIVGIEYSEHSSYDELRRFVRFLRPREVISTVPYGNTNMNRTPQVPASWYQGPIKPERPSLQTAITSYFKVGGEKGETKEGMREGSELREGSQPREGSEPMEVVVEDSPKKVDGTVISEESDWM